MKKINLKTQSLYIGCYDFESESDYNWYIFVYSSSASDKELERHFRNVVYKHYHGKKLGGEAQVDIYELNLAHNYSTNKEYKIALCQK